MAMVPMVSAESSPGITVVTTPQQDNDSLNAGTLQKVPTFQPGINDKLSYNEEQQLLKKYVPIT